MPFDGNFSVMFAACMIAAISGAASGLTGFGFGLISIPLLLMILPGKAVVPLSIMLGLVSRAALVRDVGAHLKWARVGPILVAGIIAIPLGALLLYWVDARVVRLMLGTLVCVSATLILLGITITLRDESSARIPIGVISGLMHGGAGMGGPPLVLFMANQRAEKQQTRADLTALATAFSVVALAVQAWYGLIGSEILLLVAWMCAPVLAGTWFGARLAAHVSEVAFRRIILILILTSGVAAVASSV